MSVEDRPEKRTLDGVSSSAASREPETGEISEATATEELTRVRGVAERGRADLILIAHPRTRLLGSRYSLAEGERQIIGRSAEAEIRLEDVTSVSRRHAALSFANGVVALEDLGSTNGTFVDGRRVGSRPVELRSGERFQVGGVHFKLLRHLDIESAYHEALFELAVRDGLTGALNRKRFEEEVERELARARRHDRPLSVILFDVDRFKRVNDRHGHVVGDQVLRSLVALAQGELAQEELLARLGGEEFGVLVPEVSLERAHDLAERLRSSIVERTQECFPGVAVTCSFGIVSLEAGDREWQDLYRRADAALYRAKKRGRDRVERG